MAGRFQLLQRLRRPRLPLFLHASSPKPIFSHPSPPPSALSRLLPFHTPPGPAATPWGAARSFSHGTVNLVLSGGTPKFETHEAEPPKKDKWKTKKRLKLQRKREKRKRKDANRRDPRRVGPKGKKKHKLPDAESRIKYKLEMAKIKEAMLVEKLKRYEVPKLQGPIVKPEILTGEERFYMQKMAQKQSNYVPVGRRGVFGGVILNMHLHWKKHETVEVICKPCKPGQVKEYARDIARLSGGTPIKIIGDDTIIFYRGKNYVQPEVMSPVDTLSKKKALEKSKYEQSLETVRRFIAISEKELELYYRHVALYGDPNSRNSDLVYGDQKKSPSKLEVGKSHSLEMESCHSISDVVSTDLFVSADQSDESNLTGDEADSAFEDLTEPEIDSDVTEVEVDSEYEELSEMEVDQKDEKTAQSFTVTAA